MNSDSTNREAQAIPQELIGPVPREVGLSGKGITLWIIAALLLALIPLFAIWFCLQLQNRTALRRDGRVVTGEVTRIWTTRAPNESVRYTFTVDDEAYSGKADIPVNFVRRFRESDNILVRYLPANPRINHPDAWEWSVNSYWGLYCFMIFAVMMSNTIITILLRERRLVCEGVIAIGAVTRSKQDKDAIRIEYKFRTEDGRLFVGTGVSSITEIINANILVLYLPQNPKRNSPYSMLNYWAGGPVISRKEQP